MSRIDILKSLLRSGALSAAHGLRSLPVTAAIERLIGDIQLGRARLSDAELTAAIGKLPGVTQATVSCRKGLIATDLGFDDGTHVSFALKPVGVQFAPGGAKELSFAVDPPEVAATRASEVVAKLAAVIARAIWSPVLSRAPQSAITAYASRDGDRLVIDLRTVPEVRWALSRRWGQATIELLRLRTLQVEQGHLALSIALEGLR